MKVPKHGAINTEIGAGFSVIYVSKKDDLEYALRSDLRASTAREEEKPARKAEKFDVPRPENALHLKTKIRSADR